MSQLPLTALRAFEKVAEHLSFTRAAQALYVSQSAVSQQIAQLEERTGKRLVERSGRGLKLTPQGEVLATACQHSFGALERALKRVSRGGGRSLHVRLPPTIAMKWLVPKLMGFQLQNPDLELQISTSVQPVDFDIEDVDIGMQRAAQADPGLHAIPIMDERGILVCSPTLWAGRTGNLSELSSMTLLRSVNRQDDWALWSKGMNAPELAPAKHIDFSFSLLMYQAALEGLGMCIAQPELVEDDLVAGRLIAPFPQVISTGRKQFLVCPARLRHDPAVSSFFAWVQSKT
jgi:LysR family transcriptional regulator, glycine cleavage system transcriptional activator